MTKKEIVKAISEELAPVINADCRCENGKDPDWGIRVSQPGNACRWGNGVVASLRVEHGGCSHVDMCLVIGITSSCESMHVNE